ncbi:TROVE domain-containing protein [Chitinophaga ginsengisoli]|uniref:TROVE domain-containing protein n=1 Tax=Chitinophaga ginsengisoli TaxID=363837 RepID=A0A2P8GHB6_9BACT|nr:TROVE domain-containing protein [Chitinophaga ginsengisoli]PSL33366.1 TROVE domain-containing protein [Chitinophaga ginsengisoli]
MRFNFLKTTTPVTNHEGTKAYKLTPAMELYSAVVTASLQDQFYEKTTDKLERLRSLIAKNDPGFVARLAVYTREKMYLRSVPLVLAVELARTHKGDNLVSRMTGRIVQRADEITELLAYYALANNRKEVKQLNNLSKQLQKGLAISFNKFDEYQFAKYNRKAAVTLRDALFVVHPKAKDESQQALFNKIVQDDLQTPYTWETELSAAGQVTYDSDKKKAMAFKKVWEELIDSNKLGYMATLRNLRNMLDYDVSTEHLQKVCATLSDREAVLKSKQLPFRYLSAYRELKNIDHGMIVSIKRALEKALQTSVEHLKGFDAKTRVVIACDVSGSMQKTISPKSKVMLYDIGLLLGMLLQHKCEYVIAGMFGDTWKRVSMSPDNILANVDEFYRREGEVGYATNGYLVLDNLIKRKGVVEKIMLFTDGQLWDSNTNNTAAGNTMSAKWAEYKRIAPNAKLYLFDLAGYKSVPLDVRQNDVFLIAGWSDKIFEIMDAIEKGSDAITEIAGLAL